MMVDLLYGVLPFEVLVSPRHRISFVYVERAWVRREDNSLVILKEGEVYDLPTARLASLLLGPGVSISTAALMELARWGVSTTIVTGGGFKVHQSFASGSPKSAKLQLSQAQVVANKRRRLSVAKQMYALRWRIDPDALQDHASIRSLSQEEGRRVKALYAKMAKEHGVLGFHRNPRDTSEGVVGDVNRALTQAKQCIYGACNGAILGLGLTPALGIIHNGNSSALTHDLADLFLEEVSIPFAFAHHAMEASEQRRALRKVLAQEQVMMHTVDTLLDLFGTRVAHDSVDQVEDFLSEDESMLWDGVS